MATFFKVLLALLVVANLVVGAAWFGFGQGLLGRLFPEPPATEVERGPWPLPPLPGASDADPNVGATTDSAPEQSSAESSPSAVVDGDVEREGVASPVEDSAASTLRCVVLGPFENEAAADAEAARIVAAGGEAEATQEQAQPSSYMVYIEPAASEGEAARIWRELRTRSIDAFVIPSGVRRNAVSVGVFSARDRAEAQRRRIAALGYSVAVHAPAGIAHRVVARNAPPDLFGDVAAAPCD